MATRRACSAKFRKYRAPVLSVLLHTLALAGILINVSVPQLRQQSGSTAAAIMMIAAADITALPPWPVIDSEQGQVADSANAAYAESDGNAPLLHTNNAFPLPDTAVRPLAAQEPTGTTPHLAEQQLSAYGHYDPAIFTGSEEPAHNGRVDAAGATQITPSLPATRPTTLANLPGNGLGTDGLLKGQFRVRIVTTKDNAYVVVEIMSGNKVMRSLLDETAQHFQTKARYAETSDSHNGDFAAPVLAALP